MILLYLPGTPILFLCMNSPFNCAHCIEFIVWTSIYYINFFRTCSAKPAYVSLVFIHVVRVDHCRLGLCPGIVHPIGNIGLSRVVNVDCLEITPWSLYSAPQGFNGLAWYSMRKLVARNHVHVLNKRASQARRLKLLQWFNWRLTIYSSSCSTRQLFDETINVSLVYVSLLYSSPSPRFHFSPIHYRNVCCCSAFSFPRPNWCTCA